MLHESIVTNYGDEQINLNLKQTKLSNQFPHTKLLLVFSLFLTILCIRI